MSQQKAIITNADTNELRIGNEKAEEFEAELGVRQGCPLSLLLFELYFDPLLKYLDLEMEGIHLNEINEKFKAFVDDLTTFTCSDEDHRKAIKCIEKYCEIFELELNKNKCEVLCIGEEHEESFNGITRKSEIKVLGVAFQKSWTLTERENWKVTLSKFRNALSYGYERNMTIFQKAQYVNTYCCPILWYLANISAPKKKTLKKLKSAIYQFVWQGKEAPRPRMTDMFLKKKEGGLQIIEIEAKSQELYVKTAVEEIFSSNETGLKEWLRASTEDRQFPKKLESLLKEVKEIFERRMADTEKGTLDRKELKDYYLKKMQVPPIKSIQEGEKTQAEIENIFEWLNELMLPAKVKEHMFIQLHNILPTEERKLRIKIKDVTGTCKRCDSELETLEHALLKCEKIKEEKEKLQTLLEKITKNKIDLEKLIKLDGLGPVSKATKDVKSIAYIVSTYCYYTWKSKVKEKDANMIIHKTLAAWELIKKVKDGIF